MKANDSSSLWKYKVYADIPICCCTLWQQFVLDFCWNQ